MPSPKDFLRAQANVLSQLPDPVSPQVAASLIQVANSLPETPTAPAVPGGRAFQLPIIGAVGLPQLPTLGGLPGLAGGPITGPIEFLLSLEASLPTGSPKLAAGLAGGFRTIETPPKPENRPSGGVLGGGYRSI